MKHRKNSLRRNLLCMATGLFLATMSTQPLLAQNVTGAVAGQAEPGTQVTISNTDTGFVRTVTADASGSYRLSLLPPGNYTLQAAGGEPVQLVVNLGSTTTVNLGNAGATSLEAIQVIGSRIVTPVDVTSTESATNITAEEVARLPVDRNVQSVALLAPGVSQGTASFGGVSFGGSSVAENAFYINGLNVTDFYNRVGFSEAPFSFYQDFQIKTGGYSVEFGRTTGGVVNALAKSGSNEWRSGAELVWTPQTWQSPARDSYYVNSAGQAERYITRSRDFSDSTRLNVWSSGPIVKDRLFFLAMYEARNIDPVNTDSKGNLFTEGDATNGFWGTTLDWQINDTNRLSLMAFSNKNRLDNSNYNYDFDKDIQIGGLQSESYSESGGRNWALTWTSYIFDNLSMRVMHGQNNRQSKQGSPSDPDCNYITVGNGVPTIGGVAVGCGNNSSVYDREDTRNQTRADFEWILGPHLLRFGVDDERNVSDLNQYYPGPGGVQYGISSTTPGAVIPNSGGGVVPPGYYAYVRARQYSVSGNFESTNRAYYLEDNWSLTDNLILNLGLRQESFDNKDAEGNSYIEMSNMWSPRIGFSWDVVGDSTMKLFGNAGRYFLPVANVINIKQAGALLDARTYYGFDGWELRQRNGETYAFPILGPRFGFYDGQGNGTVGDLRSEVDRDMDQVYQDEMILGFQQQLNSTWSWGARGIYRKLHNAIDDMEISATAQCGEDGYIGWVMANPGAPVTVWGDTNCDGNADGWVTIDTAKEGWAIYDDIYTYRNGAWKKTDSIYKGQRGWEKPRRDYKAIELQVDRVWDQKWAFNASYTLSWSEGNAEGPVNTDTNFGDTGRTENFDDPWVNFNGFGPLANDHRHQLKLRGTYALTDNWRIGGTLDARSGGPISAFGVGNPYDATSYHSYYICTQMCAPPANANEGDTWSSSQRVYTHHERGGEGRMPWIVDLGASISYEKSFGSANFRAKLAVFNLLNKQRPVWVYQELEPAIGDRDEFYRKERFLQNARYGQLTVSLDF